MGLSDLFKKKSYQTTPKYNHNMLITAYENMRWRKHDDEDIGMMTFPVNASGNNDVEIYFHSSKGNADALIRDLFKVLYLLDTVFDDGRCSNDYDIMYFDVFDDKITIGYWGTKEATNYDVEVFKEAGRWHCKRYGMKIFEPPKYLSE